MGICPIECTLELSVESVKTRPFSPNGEKGYYFHFIHRTERKYSEANEASHHQSPIGRKAPKNTIIRHDFPDVGLIIVLHHLFKTRRHMPSLANKSSDFIGYSQRCENYRSTRYARRRQQ